MIFFKTIRVVQGNAFLEAQKRVRGGIFQNFETRINEKISLIYFSICLTGTTKNALISDT